MNAYTEADITSLTDAFEVFDENKTGLVSANELR